MWFIFEVVMTYLRPKGNSYLKEYTYMESVWRIHLYEKSPLSKNIKSETVNTTRHICADFIMLKVYIVEDVTFCVSICIPGRYYIKHC